MTTDLWNIYLLKHLSYFIHHIASILIWPDVLISEGTGPIDETMKATLNQFFVFRVIPLSELRSRYSQPICQIAFFGKTKNSWKFLVLGASSVAS